MPRRLTWRERSFRAETEDSFNRWILDAAHIGGWKAVHWRPARNERGSWRTNYMGDGKGWPDWIFIREKDMIAAEVERELMEPPPEQMRYLEEFSRIEVVRSFVWRPSSREEIAKVLAGGQGRLL